MLVVADLIRHLVLSRYQIWIVLTWPHCAIFILLDLTVRHFCWKCVLFSPFSLCLHAIYHVFCFLLSMDVSTMRWMLFSVSSPCAYLGSIFLHRLPFLRIRLRSSPYPYPLFALFIYFLFLLGKVGCRMLVRIWASPLQVISLRSTRMSLWETLIPSSL